MHRIEQLESRVLLSVPPVPTNPGPGSNGSPGPTELSSSVGLSWNVSSGATYYEVAVRNLSTNAIVIDTTTSALAYTASLTAGTPYRWDVAAGNSSGESNFTTPLYFQTPAAGPLTPTNPSPGSTNSPGPTELSNTVGLSWGASSGATYYEVAVRNLSTNSIVIDTTTTNLAYTASLTAATPYRWDVAAGNSSGESSFTTPLYFQTPVALLPGPTITSPGTASDTGNTVPNLTPTMTWDSVGGATSYGLYISQAPYGTANIIYSTTVAGSSTSFTLPTGTLQNGVKYRWNMTSINSAGEGSVNNTLYFQTPVALLPGPTITSPGAATDTGYTVPNLTPTMTWDSVGGATSYGLYISQAPYGMANIIYSTTLASSGTSFTLPTGTLQNGVNYRWNMTSINSAGEGSVNNTLYFQTQGTISTNNVYGVDFAVPRITTNGDKSPGTVTWSQVNSSGGTFAFIKATQDNVGDFLPTNLSSPSNTYTFGLYDFADPDDYFDPSSGAIIQVDPNMPNEVSADAKAEADFFYQTAEPFLTAGHLLPALDLEDEQGGGGFNSPNDGLTSGYPQWSWPAIENWVQDWTAEFQTHMPGVFPIIYTQLPYAHYLGLNQNEYKLWIAIGSPGSPVIPFPSDIYWPGAIEQYQTDTSSTYPPDLDVLNSSNNTTLASLEIGGVGTTITWTGADSNSWADPQNWSDQAIPTSSNDVIIPSGSTPAIGSGSFTMQSLTLQGNAQVDIGTGSLAIDYGVGNSSPLSSIESELASGYNNRAWNGNGIISSAAAANPGFAVGYADGSVDIGTAVPSGQVLIKYVPIGDVDLDGTVNLTDLLDLLNGYGQSGRDWTQGDTNYDGTVNLTDLLDLLNNYGFSGSATSALTPKAAVLAYKATSTPFASEPLALNSAGGFSAGGPGNKLDDVDGEILGVGASVL